jgi:hypothetical protein
VSRISIDLEYVLCLNQQGGFNYAIRSHRLEGGHPLWVIDTTASEVVWRLERLTDGVPEVPKGTRDRVDRVDFYILQRDLKPLLAALPPALAPADPTHRLPPTDSRGTERYTGKTVRPLAQISRYGGVSSIRWENRHSLPYFAAHASGAELHLDVELTPEKGYGAELPELHFGLSAHYSVAGVSGPGVSFAEIRLPHSLYALIVADLRFHVR